jgi:hypothetical protein
MNGPINILLAIGVLFVSFDLIVLRLVLRKRPGHGLVVAGTACVVLALLLLWLLPPSPAH